MLARERAATEAKEQLGHASESTTNPSTSQNTKAPRVAGLIENFIQMSTPPYDWLDPLMARVAWTPSP